MSWTRRLSRARRGGSGPLRRLSNQVGLQARHVDPRHPSPARRVSRIHRSPRREQAGRTRRDRAMPTALRKGSYRVFFYSSDGAEPPHVHVSRDGAQAKYWLDPVRLERSAGFRLAEELRIRRIISGEREYLIDAWHDFFD